MDSGEQGQARRQLETLGRIASIAGQDLALDPLLQRVVDALAAEFDWEFVACAVVDHARGEFVCRALHSRLRSDVGIGYRRALGSGVVGECAATGRSFDIDDTRGHPNFVDTLDGTRSELCVPVLHDGRVLAVLNAESLRVGAFRGQLTLFQTVASLVAGVIHAAGLLEQLQLANRQLQDAYRTLENTSRTDALTGIANRRRFDYWLAEAGDAAQRSGRPMAVLLVDVDHFKDYNDSYGHPAGDACLRRIARCLADVVEGSPLRLARYGGEEFAAIASGVDRDGMLATAEWLRSAVEALDIGHGGSASGRVSISIGVAVGVPGEDGPERLTEAADAALYRAKRNGRNRVESAPPG
jgi:diguanylate cyclase (GGDEF)-like protein